MVEACASADPCFFCSDRGYGRWVDGLGWADVEIQLYCIVMFQVVDCQ